MFDPMDLFGEAHEGEDPWHQYYHCELRMVKGDVVQCIHHAVGVSGFYHDGIKAYVIDNFLWQAVLDYFQHLDSLGLDVDFHIEKVLSWDKYYVDSMSKGVVVIMTANDDK